MNTEMTENRPVTREYYGGARSFGDVGITMVIPLDTLTHSDAGGAEIQC